MSTTAELFEHRNTAGERYAAAVLEFRAAFADLAAIDRLLERSQGCVPGFGGEFPDPIAMRHQTFAPDVGGRVVDDIAAAFEIRNRAYGTPD